MTMTPERLAEIRDRVTYNPEDWPITIELVAHIDTITAENDRLKGEVERLKRLNTSLVYGHDIFKLAALRVESTLRASLAALVTAGEKVVDTRYTVRDDIGDHEYIHFCIPDDVFNTLSAALAAAVREAKGEK